MEYKKDNRFGSERFIGQHNQGNKHTKPNQGYGYIVRKTEKLTTALYLVTDILSEKEPMKWKSRETGVDVLSDVTVAGSGTLSEKLSILRVVLKKIDKVISFLDIAAATRMMSEMNATVLKNEYIALKSSIESEWERTQERSKSILNDRFFEVRADEMQDLENIPQDKPHVALPERMSSVSSDTSSNNSITTATVEKYAPLKEERTFVQQTPTPAPKHVSPPPSPRTHATPSTNIIPEKVQQAPAFVPRPPLMDKDVIVRAKTEVSRDDRRKIILALIKQKPALTVGDIAKSIPGVSEKTIQRELLSMVTEHILVKKGERRWSTYMLHDGYV